MGRESTCGLAVLSLRRPCCFLLLALWLAATQHCGLEAAGIEFLGHGDPSSDSCETGCADDGCPAIEGVSYTPATASLRLMPPEVVLADPRVRLLEPVLENEPSELRLTEAAPDIEAIPRAWRFEQRAALLARAPDLST